MSEKPIRADDSWPVSWEAARKAQFRDVARSTPSQRLHWLEDALRLASASGALLRAETPEKRRMRGLT
jgi:hypothetical protein